MRQVSQYAEEETFNSALANELEGTVIRLTFTGHSTHKPIVGELTLRYGLPFNILHGKMTQTAHGVFGQLWVHVVAFDEHRTISSPICVTGAILKARVLSMAEDLFPHLKWDQLWAATQETLYMTALSGVATFVLGLCWPGAALDCARWFVPQPCGV